MGIWGGERDKQRLHLGSDMLLSYPTHVPNVGIYTDVYHFVLFMHESVNYSVVLWLLQASKKGTKMSLSSSSHSAATIIFGIHFKVEFKNQKPEMSVNQTTCHLNVRRVLTF